MSEYSQVVSLSVHFHTDKKIISVENFNGEWDGSDIQVLCHSLEKLIVFSVLNAGKDMQGETEWSLYKGETLEDSGAIKLKAGESKEFFFQRGESLRFTVNQRPGHPVRE